MKRSKLSTCVFYTLIILVILFVISTYLSSNLVAKYSSSDSILDSARVAKWNINFTTKNGNVLESFVESTHLEYGSYGEWGLDISNNSEVTAKFSDFANIKIRLQSPNFHVDHHHETWDFLGGDNPINFRVYMYNCSLADLSNNEVSKKEVVIFKTDEKTLKFDMVIEEGNLYYESVINVGNLLDKDFILDYGTGKACLKVFWEVDENSAEAVDTSNKFYSYHAIPVSEYNLTKYQGLVDKTNESKLIPSATISNSYKYTFRIEGNDEDYVIAYREHDYFEYLIYTSSLGGEVMVNLIDKDDSNKTYVKRCTKLSDDEKQQVTDRTVNSITDVTSLKKYVEKLEYLMYLNFEQTQNDYNKAQGYLSLGLTCRIILDLKVEQVD